MKRVIASFTVCVTVLIALALMPSVSVAADDYGDECPAADANQLLALNSSISGSIDFIGDYDYFRVEVEVEGLLTVEAVSTEIDSYGYLYDSNCSLLMENDDRFGSQKLSFWISQPVTPGTYFIAVKDRIKNGTGNYTLQVDFTPGAVSDDFGSNCATAASIALDSSTPGDIDYLGDYDFFRVELPESGTLTIETTDQTAINSYGYLYDMNCSLLVENDNVNGDNFQISLQLQAGYYFVAVRHRSYNDPGSTGSYTLAVEFKKGNIQDDYGNDCAAAEPLALNSSMAGDIDFLGDYDYFSIGVPEFGLLTVGTIEPTVIDSYGYLYDAGCLFIAENDDAIDGEGLDFQISGYAAAGSYFVAVRPFDNTNPTGSYTIQVDFAPGAIPGDINLDLVVDLADLLLVLQITTGFMPENVAIGADVNGDNKIDPRDALYVLQKIAGLRP